MSFLDGTFHAGPCDAKDTFSGKLCGGTIFSYIDGIPMLDCGYADPGWAKCCTCGATYDLGELDDITDAAEAANEAREAA